MGSSPSISTGTTTRIGKTNRSSDFIRPIIRPPARLPGQHHPAGFTDGKSAFRSNFHVNAALDLGYYAVCKIPDANHRTDIVHQRLGFCYKQAIDKWDDFDMFETRSQDARSVFQPVSACKAMHWS